ncbi:MAG: hypothetical protein ABW199_08335, partial [Caulobacterales bacterium]
MTRVLKEVSEADFKAVQEAAEARAEKAQAASEAGSAVFLLSILLALVWVIAIGIGAYAFYGAQKVSALSPIEIAALAALAFLPALMVLMGGATGREGARARAEARRLADAAEQLLNPAPSAEAATRRLALAVRGEIGALDRALEQTLARIKSVESEIANQRTAVDQIAEQARQGADHMILGMERERSELLRISQELTAQAQHIGQSISRHTTSISDAARVAEAEVRAADEALDARISSFGAAAALITDRTQALTGAAQASADSSLKLEQALSNALDILAKATHLTDAARASAQAAAFAANATAGSARDTTTRSLEDARRAADAIRGQAATVEKEAGDALERLRDAANSARNAAHDVRGAVDQPAQARTPAPRTQPPQPIAPHSKQNMFGDTPPSAPSRERPAEAPGGAWTWRDLLSNIDEEEAAAPEKPRKRQSSQRESAQRDTAPAKAEPERTREAPQERGRERERAPETDPVARLTKTVTEPRIAAHPLPAAAVIERAGVSIANAFSRGALDRIAQRARNGTQARRGAVRSAAPDAVNAVADFLDRDANARQEAAAFLRADGARIAELLARGRATMTADATR